MILSLTGLPLRSVRAQNPPTGGTLTRPLPGLDATQLDAFEAGKAVFVRTWDRDAGLGPRFNARSCVACHRQPAIGGLGPRYRSNMTFGRQQPDGFDPLNSQGGPLLQERAVWNVSKETLPAAANVVSLRRVPPLFGLGLVEAIPEAQILALADPFDTDGDGISGRAILSPDGRVQRFGSQNQMASLRGFVTQALAEEIGLTGDEVSPDIPALLTAFVTFLAPLPPGEPSADAVQGEALFGTLGCGACHVPSFTTHDGPFQAADGDTIDVAGLQHQVLFPYSDFLLHDMGAALDDGVALGRAGSSEFRTAPLWGFRFRSGRLLHDGRAVNLRQAMFFHGGEARAAREAYLSLSTHDQRLLEVFLKSL